MNSAAAEEISVLSAGAVEPGILRIIDTFRRETGHEVKTTFATAPAISKRAGTGETVHIVIAPPAVLDEWVKAGKATQAGRVTVGHHSIVGPLNVFRGGERIELGAYSQVLRLNVVNAIPDHDCYGAPASRFDAESERAKIS